MGPGDFGWVLCDRCGCYRRPLDHEGKSNVVVQLNGKKRTVCADVGVCNSLGGRDE